MPLNIKNQQVERLAEEVSRLTRETKTEAIRKALEERKARLVAIQGRPQGKQDVIEFFERAIWSRVPATLLGKRMTKREREKVLGYGPHGV